MTKKTDKKPSHYFVYSRRATQDPHHTWHGDRGGPSRFRIPLTFFDPISSFAARSYWKIVGKCPHRGKLLISWLYVPKSDETKTLMRTNAVNFVKIVQTSPPPDGPWGTDFWPKIEIFTVLGAVFPHFCPDKRDIWQRVATAAWNPIFGPLSKNNTGMAALQTRLQVRPVDGFLRAMVR